MLLKKKEIVTSKSKIKVSFEKMADDLLMISLSNEIHNQGILSYWRLTKVVGMPPLEIGIDCQEGFISSATFFVDGLAITESEDVNTSIFEGNILVDTGIFTKANDYIDVEQAYDINICKDKLICSFVKAKEFKNTFRNDRVEIFVDCNNQIVGFSICDLSEDEKNLINSIQRDRFLN